MELQTRAQAISPPQFNTGCCPPFDPAPWEEKELVWKERYRNAGKWAEDMRRHVVSKQRQLEKLYFAYPTCPACAKAYGRNYVVGFAQVCETH